MVYNINMTTHRIYLPGTATATQITPVGTHSGMDITIQNANMAGYIYVGGEGVTTTNYGYRLMPNHAISFELSGSDDLYIIAELADMQVAVLSTSLELGQ